MMKPTDDLDYRKFYSVHDMLDKLTKLEAQNAAMVEALEAVMKHYPNAISWAEDGGAYSREDLDSVFAAEKAAEHALALAEGDDDG